MTEVTGAPPGATVAVVQQFLSFLAKPDVDAACRLIADDAVIDEAASLPFGGVRTGPDGFRSIVADVAGSFRLRLGQQRVHEAGPLVVVTFEAWLESRRTGRDATMSVVDLYTVEAGRITRLDVFYKDTAAVVGIERDERAPTEGSRAQ